MIPPRPCEKCGEPHVTHLGHQACKAHSSRTGAGCRKPPMAGQLVCRNHGGASGSHRRAGARKVAEQRAMRAMQRFGGAIDTTATEGLLDTVKWTAGFVAWLRNVVEQLRVDELGWGVTQEKTGGQDWGTTEKAAPNVYVAMLGEWTDRYVRVCAEAIKAGIDERRVRLAEQQGALVADVIRRVLADLQLTPEQSARSGEAVVRHLRALTA